MSILFKFILAVHVIIALGLVGIILLQRSEGGVLGIGGGTSGLMTARGAADLLTRGTRWLGVGFLVTSIALAVVAARDRKGDNSVIEEIDKAAATAPKPAVPSVPIPGLDMSFPGGPTSAAPASAPPVSADPLKAPASVPIPGATPATDAPKQ
jgi:preprotein translocase subunit SecG